MLGGGVLCVCLNIPVYVLGIGLWPGRGGLNIGASGGEDRCAACRGRGRRLMSGIHPMGCMYSAKYPYVQ